MVMKVQAFLAGIEKRLMEQLFLLTELILEFMKLQMQITIADCCLGKYSVLFITVDSIVAVIRRRFLQVTNHFMKFCSTSLKSTS